MRQAKVLYKNEVAGLLSQLDDGSFVFSYDAAWRSNTNKPSISLTLPKNKKKYQSPFLFPFFFNMLPEGTNKQVVCNYHKIDEDDYFGLLMITAKTDSIGAVTIIKI
jgi:HipA-like protein